VQLVSLVVLLLLFFINFFTFSGTRKSQQAQTLRLKQEKFYKLAAQAKQRGISHLTFFNTNLYLNIYL